MFFYFQKVKGIEWTNLSSQSLMPTFSSSFYQLGAKQGMEIISQTHSTCDSFNGGGCMLISGKVSPTQQQQTRTVFRLATFLIF